MPYLFNSCKNCKELFSLLFEPRELVVPPETLGRASSAQRWPWKGKQGCFLEAVEEAGRGFRLATGSFEAAAGKFALPSVSFPA